MLSRLSPRQMEWLTDMREHGEEWTIAKWGYNHHHTMKSRVRNKIPDIWDQFEALMDLCKKGKNPELFMDTPFEKEAQK